MQFHIFIIELQYQYLNYITGIPVLYKILKKIHNTGTNFYTSDRQYRRSINTNIIKQKQYILLLSRLMCKKKMFEQKRFAGRHLLPFESQKLNYFGKKVGPAF